MSSKGGLKRETFAEIVAAVEAKPSVLDLIGTGSRISTAPGSELFSASPKGLDGLVGATGVDENREPAAPGRTSPAPCEPTILSRVLARLLRVRAGSAARLLRSCLGFPDDRPGSTSTGTAPADQRAFVPTRIQGAPVDDPIESSEV
jgi:hypothetical protein